MNENADEKKSSAFFVKDEYYSEMPLIPSHFHTSPLLKNGHMQTIVPALFYKAPRPAFVRERLELPDGDFIDLDWLRGAEQKPLFILCHGLEGSSDNNYINKTAMYLQEKGFPVLAWNYRGCSGEMNRNLRFYHSGETGDLNSIIHYCIQNGFTGIVLMGFSLGGNIVLKYMGEQGRTLLKEIKAGIAVSAPIDLAAAARQLNRKFNKIYLARFLKSLKQKVIEKAAFYPHEIDINEIDNVKDFYSYDDRFTAPIHGFKDASEYYRLSSSRQYLRNIHGPVLLIQPADDPFLPEECYPEEESADNPYVYLEIPGTGGHLGFLTFKRRPYYPVCRAVEFIGEIGYSK